MRTRVIKAVAAAALTAMGLVAASGANAALLSRLGGQALYDDVANLTWLQDANYARTSGYDDDGVMSWADANTWAGSLNIDGVTGWRLPGGPMGGPMGGLMVPFDYNHTASELGNLFYNVLGGVANSPISATDNVNYDLFSNVQSYGVFWSSAEYCCSYYWGFGGGYWAGYDESHELFGWAVHPGDVGASPVPVPSNGGGSGIGNPGDVGASPVPVPGALLLMGPALLGLLGVKRGERRA